MNVNSLNHHLFTAVHSTAATIFKYWLIPWNWPNLLHKYICFFIMALNTEGNVFKRQNFIIVRSRLKLSWLLQPQIFNLAINFLINFFSSKNMCYIPSSKNLVVHSFYLFHFLSGVCAVQLPFCENSFGCIKWRIKNILSQNVKLWGNKVSLK